MDPTHDPAIAELLSFFDFAHLRERTPHLAAASEPFHRLAHAMAQNPRGVVDGLRAVILRMDSEDGREAAAAALKLRRLEVALVAPDYAVVDATGIEDFLRTLLEAKDCAVRAALVRHRSEQAQTARATAERDHAVFLDSLTPGSRERALAFAEKTATGEWQAAAAPPTLTWSGLHGYAEDQGARARVESAPGGHRWHAWTSRSEHSEGMTAMGYEEAQRRASAAWVAMEQRQDVAQAVPRVQEALSDALSQDLPWWLAREAVGLPADEARRLVHDATETGHKGNAELLAAADGLGVTTDGPWPKVPAEISALLSTLPEGSLRAAHHPGFTPSQMQAMAEHVDGPGPAAAHEAAKARVSQEMAKMREIMGLPAEPEPAPLRDLHAMLDAAGIRKGPLGQRIGFALADLEGWQARADELAVAAGAEPKRERLADFVVGIDVEQGPGLAALRDLVAEFGAVADRLEAALPDDVAGPHVDALRGLHNAPPPVIVSRTVRTFTDEDGCPHVVESGVTWEPKTGDKAMLQVEVDVGLPGSDGLFSVSLSDGARDGWWVDAADLRPIKP